MEIILRHGRPLTLNEGHELERKLREIAPEITFFSYRRGWGQFHAELQLENATGYPVILFANALQENFAASYTMVIAASGLPKNFKKLFPGYSIKWIPKQELPMVALVFLFKLYTLLYKTIQFVINLFLWYNYVKFRQVLNHK